MQQERLLFGALQSIKAGSRSIQRMAMSRPLRGLTDLALPGKFLASGAREKGLPFRQVALSALGRPSSAGLSWRDGWVFRPGKLSFSSAPVRVLSHSERFRRAVDRLLTLRFHFSILVPPNVSPSSCRAKDGVQRYPPTGGSPPSEARMLAGSEVEKGA
jgi:hypothetical protein